MSLPAGRWALYAGWIWLGWDLLPTEGAPLSGRPWASRVRRGLVIAAVLGYAWWAAFLRSEVRWVDVLVPAAGLLAIALFGHLRRSTPISSMARATRDWIELQLRRARR
ncbi:MAG TPA: hypothetical protein VE646_04100 [Actinomycetota bacterium]|jgi:hypothetical protein|nr:hypothetical protein [Actinomycetota bacterium]